MAKLYAARIAGMLGINTNIMSFSINEVTHGLKDTMSELPNNVSLVARDPVSFKRLQDKNIPKIHCSSDLSYLFKPSSVRNDERLQAYLKNKEGKLIGFSFNNLLFSAKEDNAARFDFYAAAICGLIERSNMSIILIPNNVKDSTKYSLELNRRIEQRCPGSTFLTEYLGDPAELKALMSKCRYYFSTTLHMGLFPLGVGVPTTCFPYAGKFDGPLSLLGIPDSLIEVEDIPEDPSAFSEILYHHFTKADERKKQIDQNLGSVINLAKVNLVDFTQ
jgi:polysaccharide pyruvyl transferase WcaK-like protein